MDDKLTLETELVVLGGALSSETGVYWDAKKALKWFVFSLKFDISLLMTGRAEELMGISFHYREFLKQTSMLLHLSLGHWVCLRVDYDNHLFVLISFLTI